MKKILATILMLGIVVPVFARVQKPQANHAKQQKQEECFIVKGVVDANLCEVKHYSMLKSFGKSAIKGFIGGFAGTVGSVVAFVAIANLITIATGQRHQYIMIS
jgi:hypothetical protein